MLINKLRLIASRYAIQLCGDGISKAPSAVLKVLEFEVNVLNPTLLHGPIGCIILQRANCCLLSHWQQHTSTLRWRTPDKMLVHVNLELSRWWHWQANYHPYASHAWRFELSPLCKPCLTITRGRTLQITYDFTAIYGLKLESTVVWLVLYMLNLHFVK